MKAQWDKGGGRILLGNNTDDSAVMLRPIRFQCVVSFDFNFQLSVAYTLHFTTRILKSD